MLFRGGDTVLALFLEAMQNKYRLGKSHRVHGAVGSSGVVLDNLKQLRLCRVQCGAYGDEVEACLPLAVAAEQFSACVSKR